jgi:hypothetical protein
MITKQKKPKAVSRCPRCGSALRVRSGAVPLCRCAARMPLPRVA